MSNKLTMINILTKQQVFIHFFAVAARKRLEMSTVTFSRGRWLDEVGSVMKA